MRLSFASVFPPLAALTAAHPPPVYEGFQIKWFDDFAGPAGSFPNEQKWMIINAENYRRNNEAVQLSGGMSLQLNPAGDNGAWYGGRVESYYTLTPAPGKQTIIEASIGWGKNSPTTKVGVWSSFGLLAQSAAHQKYLYSSPEHMELVVLEGDNVGSKASPRAAGILRDQPGE